MLESDCDKIDKLVNSVGKLSGSIESLKSEYEERTKNLSFQIAEIKGIQEHQRKQIMEIWSKVHNGYENRITDLEKFRDVCDNKFATKVEIEGFGKSVRREINTLKWIFGAGFGVMSTLLGLIIGMG